MLTEDPALAAYFEACLAEHNAPKSIANWIMNVVLGLVNERKIEIGAFEVGPERLAGLVRLVDEGKITAQVGRDVLGKMIETGKDAADASSRRRAPSRSATRPPWAPSSTQVLAQNPQPVQDYLAGKQAALGALVGQVMRATRGKADPKLAGSLLRSKLDAMR